MISAGLHRGFKHPHVEAVQAYETAVGDEARLYCTVSVPQLGCDPIVR